MLPHLSKHQTFRPQVLLLVFTLISIIGIYYVTVLSHEYAHSTLAWMFGQKMNPFDIDYGGWLLLHVDEAVNYDQILKQGDGIAAAVIAISGVTTNIIFFLLTIYFLQQPYITKNRYLLTLFFWSAILNLVPILGYVPCDTFTTHGDIGRFVTGLNISPWWIFFVGTPLVILAIVLIFRTEILKIYYYIPIKTIAGRSLYLICSLSVLFLLLFTHGQNPFTDTHAHFYNKIFPALMISSVPILFFVCFPGRDWVTKRVSLLSELRSMQGVRQNNDT